MFRCVIWNLVVNGYVPFCCVRLHPAVHDRMYMRCAGLCAVYLLRPAHTLSLRLTAGDGGGLPGWYALFLKRKRLPVTNRGKMLINKCEISCICKNVYIIHLSTMIVNTAMLQFFHNSGEREQRCGGLVSKWEMRQKKTPRSLRYIRAERGEKREITGRLTADTETR